MKKKDKLEIGARALAKNIRVSAIKIRPILDQIRGCSYGKALVLPEFMPYKTCYLISQLIPSAAANANTHFGLNKSDLFISEARVESYTYLRRFRPRAQGQSYPIKKPICKVTIKSNSNIIGEIKR
uniref:Large ribosomal subunit protein uL22c n=1 Tax=Lomariopsis japurensis TaxID=373558 RepID=A0A5B9RC11_9MONI|nr:ribosomal protein L22 [Lomariopsis japurensis]QEG57476.1 ribosomal protein L22 [Lomariopsis japurensis]